VAWHFSPSFSLFVFILFSAFHFGEAELKENSKYHHSVLPVSSFLLGLCILLSIIFSHYSASAQIITFISPGLHNYLFPMNWNGYAKLIVLASCLYISISSYYKEGKLPITLLLILCLGMLLPLELAFGFYFIFQHSYNAWQHLQIGLALPAKTLYKQAMPYTLGAILIGVVFYFFNAASMFQLSHYAGLFFIFLACISLPHFVLMHLFYKQSFNK
jgi:Brp/Blh family beta-carotene 15,15'-monooxygenase